MKPRCPVPGWNLTSTVFRIRGKDTPLRVGKIAAQPHLTVIEALDGVDDFAEGRGQRGVRAEASPCRPPQIALPVRSISATARDMPSPAQIAKKAGSSGTVYERPPRTARDADLSGCEQDHVRARAAARIAA